MKDTMQLDGLLGPFFQCTLPLREQDKYQKNLIDSHINYECLLAGL